MKDKGILTVISGFSGTGKGTVVHELVKHYQYGISISATTRQPRKGEEEGREYFFKTREEFEEMIKNDELIEYAEYVGNYYGTPKDYVVSQLEQGKDMILEIEMQGALQVKKLFPEAALIFLTPPSVEELHTRLQTRGTETEEVIVERLQRAQEECVFMGDYDYIVVNDDLTQCVTEINNLISSLHFRKYNQQSLITEITTDFENYDL